MMYGRLYQHTRVVLYYIVLSGPDDSLLCPWLVVILLKEINLNLKPLGMGSIDTQFIHTRFNWEKLLNNTLLPIVFTPAQRQEFRFLRTWPDDSMDDG